MPEDKKNNSIYDNSFFKNNTLWILGDTYENSYGIPHDRSLRRLHRNYKKSYNQLVSADKAVNQFITDNNISANTDGTWNLTETAAKRKKAGISSKETAKLFLYDYYDRYAPLMQDYVSKYNNYINSETNYHSALNTASRIPALNYNDVRKTGKLFGDNFRLWQYSSSNPDDPFQNPVEPELDPDSNYEGMIHPSIHFNIPEDKSERKQMAYDLIHNRARTHAEMYDGSLPDLISNASGKSKHKNHVINKLYDYYWDSPRSLMDVSEGKISLADFVNGRRGRIAEKYIAPGLVATFAAPYLIAATPKIASGLWNAYGWLNNASGSLINKGFQWGAKKVGQNVFGKTLSGIGKGIAQYGGLDLAIDAPIYYDLGKNLLQGDMSFGEAAMTAGPAALWLGRKPLWKGTKWLFDKSRRFLPLTGASLILGSSTSKRATDGESNLNTNN